MQLRLAYLIGAIPAPAQSGPPKETLRDTPNACRRCSGRRINLGLRADTRADHAGPLPARRREERPGVQPRAHGGQRGRPNGGAPGRARRRRGSPARRHPARRGRDRGRPEGQGRRPAELPRHRLPRRRLDDARRRLLPAFQFPRRHRRAASTRGPVCFASRQHVAASADGAAGPVRAGDRSAAGSQRVVPCAHRPRGR